MEILQQTNLHGGRKLWNAKIGTIFIYVIPLILVFEGFNYSKIRKTFFLEWQAPAECLPLYWDSNIKTSVFFTFINGVLLQCVVAVVVVILLSACAKRIHNQYAMTGVLLGGLVVPTILFPYSTVKWLRLTHDFFYVFTMQGHFMLAIVGIIVLIDLFIIWKVQGKMIP